MNNTRVLGLHTVEISRLHLKPPHPQAGATGAMSVIASLEKSRNSLQTGGLGRPSFHASL